MIITTESTVRRIALSILFLNQRTKTKLVFVLTFLCCSLFFQAGAQEKKLLRKADFSSEIPDFKRSSLAILMIETPKKEKIDAIKRTFKEFIVPNKFNDHSLGISFILLNNELKDHSNIISKKLREGQIAKKMVEKWFNRTKKGAFNLNTIKKRGLYNASAFDRQLAKSTLRGNAMLEDAGEQLIANTFVIVNDYKYTNKEEVLSKGKLLLNDVGAFIGTRKAKKIKNSTTADAAEVLAKGYVIKATSYLYRLVWNQETAARFFGGLWVTNQDYDQSKVAAFTESDIFRLDYIGRQDSWADVQSSKYTLKSDEELIERATIKATDAAISKLERKFEVFRTKTPLISIDPIAAEIGSKEGLIKGDKFEVLEQVLLEDGTVKYQKVTEITVDHDHIWDNSYLPEDIPDVDLNYTVFKGNAKNIYPGMLVRFKKNQNLFK